MLFFDGELDAAECTDVQKHLTVCPECQREFQDFAQINEVCRHTFPTPAATCWKTYYGGVCSKLGARGRYHYWALASFALVLTGNLMFLGFPNNILGMATGGAAIACGICLLWLSYFCNCKR